MTFFLFLLVEHDVPVHEIGLKPGFAEVLDLPPNLTTPDEVYQYFAQKAENKGCKLQLEDCQFYMDERRAVLAFTDGKGK